MARLLCRPTYVSDVAVYHDSVVSTSCWHNEDKVGKLDDMVGQVAARLAHIQSPFSVADPVVRIVRRIFRVICLAMAVGNYRLVVDAVENVVDIKVHSIRHLNAVEYSVILDRIYRFHLSDATVPMDSV
jgi:hypothetical protein